MEIPWDRLSMVAIAVVVICAATYLASATIAPWDDVYTLFLIILTGMGFMQASYYAGKAKAMQEALEAAAKSSPKEPVS